MKILRRTYWGLGFAALAGFLILVGTLLLATQFAAAATPPGTMNFQGRLRDSSGNILPDGQYNMQFRIFTASTGGSAVWSESREASNRVQVTNGLFSAQLGAVTPLTPSLFNATDLYFEITMATPATATASSGAVWESPMSPRSKLSTSAYAFNSATLNGKSDTDFAAASGSASYIQNTTTAQAGASFYVGGTGRVGGAFTASGTSTFTGAMTANSTAAFRSSSATAFRIQNSGGAQTLFTANTSANVIQIGSATADATAVVLVLDSSNAASDPTGINGAQYYNTSMNKFRCYENGAWKNCDTAKGTAVVKTSAYTAKDGDFIIANSSGGSFTITLPSPTNGATVSIKKVNSGNSITVTAGGVVQIDNMTSDSLSTQWLSQDYFSDGVQWYRV